jgi:predicted nucleic acid-binding protein
MLLCDTGVLLAAGNVRDHYHAACLSLMRAAEGRPLLVPSPVLSEIGYLLQSRVGAHAEVTFLKSFSGNRFHVAEVEEGDISRIAELVEQYVSLPLGIVDATMIAIAERLNLAEVATVTYVRLTGSPTKHQAIWGGYWLGALRRAGRS